MNECPSCDSTGPRGNYIRLYCIPFTRWAIGWLIREEKLMLERRCFFKSGEQYNRVWYIWKWGKRKPRKPESKSDSMVWHI